MGLKWLQNIRATIRERILIYGAPGVGKTRLALALTPRFGKIVYVAADEGSEYLSSVIEAHRERVYVVKPEGKDPIMDMSAICTTNWRKELDDSEIGTIVVDTFTKLTTDCLSYVANKGMFSSEKHIQIGPAGSPIAQAIPMQGDYGAVQSVIRNFVDALFEGQKDLHIIVVCHEQFDTPEGGGTIGGPATVGRAMLRELPSRFNTVIRLQRKSKLVKQSDGTQKSVSSVVANTDQHGYWTARIREGSATGNPIPVVELAVDSANFFVVYDENFNKETK